VAWASPPAGVPEVRRAGCPWCITGGTPVPRPDPCPGDFSAPRTTQDVFHCPSNKRYFLPEILPSGSWSRCRCQSESSGAGFGHQTSPRCTAAPLYRLTLSFSMPETAARPCLPRGEPTGEGQPRGTATIGLYFGGRKRRRRAEKAGIKEKAIWRGEVTQRRGDAERRKGEAYQYRRACDADNLLQACLLVFSAPLRLRVQGFLRRRNEFR
jgi:hypothetical protein